MFVNPIIVYVSDEKQSIIFVLNQNPMHLNLYTHVLSLSLSPYDPNSLKFYYFEEKFDILF